MLDLSVASVVAKGRVKGRAKGRVKGRVLGRGERPEPRTDPSPAPTRAPHLEGCLQRRHQRLLVSVRQLGPHGDEGGVEEAPCQRRVDERQLLRGAEGGR